jgi:hypothetical protein
MGYSDPDRYPSMSSRVTVGVRAASYGIGFVIYGLIGLASGRLLGLKGIAFFDNHSLIVSVAFIALGAFLFAFGWKHPE